VARPKRAWQPREMQMLHEWLVKTYPGKRWMTRVRLGAIMPTRPWPEMTVEERAMVGVWRRWVDALVILENRLVLVEAAIRPDPGDISRLELYKMLLPHTPELREYKDWPIDMVLLYAIEDAATVYLARQHGIRCVHYRPPWLEEYMAVLLARERRGVRFSPPGEEGGS